MNKLKETVMTMVLATRYSFSFCWRNKKWITIARIVFSILTIVVFYAVIQVTGALIDSVQISKNSFVGKTNLFEEFMDSNMIKPLVYIFLVSIFGVLIAEGDRYFRGIWRHSLQYANQLEINNHRATFDVARFRSKEHDDLSKRIQELPNAWQTRIWFSEAMFGLFSTVISFFMFGMSLLWYQPIYVLILVLTAIPMTFAEFNIVSKWWKLFQDLVPENKKRHVLERPYNERNAFLQALMFNQMPTLREQVKSSLDGVLNSYDSIRKLTLHKSVITRLIAVFGLFIVIVHTMWLISTKGGDIGTLTIVFAAARTFQGNLSFIVSTIADQWNSAKGVILIEKEFFGLKPLIKTDYPVTPRFDIVPSLRFDNVSFSYPDQEDLVLKNVNFEIKPGSKVAIVGKSGNGKSTILSLLMRHYDPTSGGVYAGDVNLKNIEPKTWNNIISALTQEYSVLSRRICDEISSSKPEYVMDLDRIIKSSQFANFDVVVDSDPGGYQSQIGTEFGGREFSGGERQRLALARVHYRGTPILILDEPDSKLDAESAEQVMNQVFALKGVTVIIITHNVFRAERCDNIIVMGKGEVAEQGTHHELMTKNGLYARISKIDIERLGSVSEQED